MQWYSPMAQPETVILHAKQGVLYGGIRCILRHIAKYYSERDINDSTTAKHLTAESFCGYSVRFCHALTGVTALARRKSRASTSKT